MSEFKAGFFGLFSKLDIGWFDIGETAAAMLLISAPFVIIMTLIFFITRGFE